jgi:quercetin dioxygenase-like cupin family protein
MHHDDDIKVVVFGFAADEELSEHTASRPALIQVLSGELELMLDGETIRVGAGSWVHMSAGLRHAVRALSPSVMLLTLVREGSTA